MVTVQLISDTGIIFVLPATSLYDAVKEAMLNDFKIVSAVVINIQSQSQSQHTNL